MGGLIGRLFHEFAVTLSLAILVSGVISLTLTPMMCSRFLKPESAYGAPGHFYRAERSRFQLDAGRLRTRSQVGLAPPALHAADHGAHDCRHRLALHHRAQGLLPAAGHRRDDRQRPTPRRTSPLPPWPSFRTRWPRSSWPIPRWTRSAPSSAAASGSSTVNNGRMFITLKPLSAKKSHARMSSSTGCAKN